MKDNQLGKNIKELRLGKNLNQLQFCEIFKVSHGTISKWENGKLEPDCDTIVEIAKYFNVSTDYLLGLE